MMIFNTLFISLSFFGIVSSKCPKKLKSISNDFNVVGRFEKMRKSVSSLKVREKRIRDNGKADVYEYIIRFCDSESAVIQTKIGGTDADTNSCGRVANSSIIGGEDWMFIMYREGKPYNSHCHKANRETWINIRCEEYGEEPTLKLIEEARYIHEKTSTEPSKCYYLFEYNHPAACVPRSKKLSGGAIFMIIFFSLFAAYLIFGFLYQRFIVHAKGFEQIPNFIFWRKVGNMSADGCDFVCRREEQSNTYKGMADALDIESSDDERDDGLLPM